MRLNELRDNAGARKRLMRVGRGIGSGKGKTCGRGVKGQTSRSGVALNGFEGGQMPLHMRIPKRGFVSRNRADLVEVTLARLQRAIDAGRLDPKKPVTVIEAMAAGLARRPREGLKLIGTGELKAKVDIEVAGATKTAIAAVEKAGGSVTVTGRLKPADVARLTGRNRSSGKAAKKKAAKSSKAGAPKAESE